MKVSETWEGRLHGWTDEDDEDAERVRVYVGDDISAPSSWVDNNIISTLTEPLPAVHYYEDDGQRTGHFYRVTVSVEVEKLEAEKS